MALNPLKDLLIYAIHYQQIQKEIPVVKTVEVPKPYEVVKHIPIIQEVEKPVVKKVPVVNVHKYTKEVSLPSIPLPSLPNVKNLFHHQHAEAHADTHSETHEESQW